MPSRSETTDPGAARQKISEHSLPAWLDGHRSLPFGKLTSEEFEILSFLLLRREHPSDYVVLYGKTQDAGQDVVHHTVNPRGERQYRLIQCKRYARQLGPSGVKAELAKLFTNVWDETIPVRPHEVVFYVSSGLSKRAKDLIDYQAKWRKVSAEALKKHFGAKQVPPKLLEFAKTWWPDIREECGIAITDRVKKFDDLVTEFFTLKSVIDGTAVDVAAEVVRQLEPRLRPLDNNVPDAVARPSVEGLTEKRVLRSFLDASRGLRRWDKLLPKGEWLDRPELDGLLQGLHQSATVRKVVLGCPGAGKSALLSMLTGRLIEAEVPVLAIKADQVPHHVATQATLAQELRLPAPVVDCLSVLSSDQPVVIIVDQLDALANLVDLRSSRLQVLLDMLHDISRFPNAHIVCSCRDFEYSYDGRLSGLDAGELSLSLPEWQDVEQVLVRHGIQTSSWPNDARDLLRIPQQLKVFLQLDLSSDEFAPFTSWQMMLEELWKQRVYSDDVDRKAAKLLNEVATVIADREELSVPTVRFTDRFGMKPVDQMVAAGILKLANGPLRIEFSHQTLYEHARARKFLGGSESLVDYVRQYQDSLFVRPTIWTSLNLLRESDTTEYVAVMNELSASGPWRAHVHFLLIDFLGELPTPSESEVRWLSQFIRNPKTQRRAIRAVTGQQGWFARLYGVVFPALMADENLNWLMIYVISEAWGFAHEQCLTLLENNWVSDPSCDEFTIRACDKMQAWSTSIVDLVCRLIRRSDLPGWRIRSLAKNLCGEHPESSVRLLAELLRKRIDSRRSGDTKGLFLFSKREDDWYGAEEIAAAAPEAFLAQVFPLVLEVEGQSHRTQNRFLNDYRSSNELDYRLKLAVLPHDGINEHGIIAGVVTAARRLAESAPDRFVAFARRYGRRNSRFIQMLLVDGWQFAASERPADCLAFLIADERRLSLGEFEDEHAISRRTIEAVVPHLDRKQFRQLERAILRFSRYREGVRQKEPENWSIRDEHNRSSRLQLFDGMPDARLSQTTRCVIDRDSAELRPSGRAVRPRRGMSRVVSPMSAAEMIEATDGRILELFDTLTDNVEHDPGDWMLGGTVEASREFEQFASSEPDRAIRIARNLRPDDQTRPAAHLVSALVDGGHPAKEILELVAEFDANGFTNYDFRETCCFALRKLAVKNQGLPPETCEMLERWLKGWPVTEHDEQFLNEGSEAGDSVLYARGGMVVLPHGTYSCLNCLCHGYLQRRRSSKLRWLSALENHMQRADRPRVWWTLAADFHWLPTKPVARIRRFAKQFFETYPQVARSRQGIIAFWTFWDYLDDAFRTRFLAELRASDCNVGPQAYGELVAARYFFRSEDAWAKQEIETLTTPEPTPERLGVCWLVSHSWKYQSCRDRASRLFERVAINATPHEAAALMHLTCYEDAFLADAATARVLHSVRNSPQLLAIDTHGWLAKRIVPLLNIEMDLVTEIAEELVSRGGENAAANDLSMSEDELVDISLRLQRSGGSWRARGLTLFESILGLGLSRAEGALRDSDRRIR